MKNEITVSIICDTYNHEKYISQCLEGFLMQKTNFNIEILIHDDASTDNTATIIREYEAKHPDIIKPIYQTENQYSKHKSGYIWRTIQFPRAKGKYVALCEGDDYWTDPLKLQKQVDFLEANEDYGLIHTDAKQYCQSLGKFRKVKRNSINSLDDLIIDNHIYTLTTCFRNDLLKDYLDNFYPQIPKFPFEDYQLWLYFFSKAKGYHLQEVTGVYKVLDNSACHFTNIEEGMFFEKKVYECRIFFLKKFFPENNYLEKKVKHRYALATLNHRIRINSEKYFLENSGLIKYIDNFILRQYYTLCKINFPVFSFAFRFLNGLKNGVRNLLEDEN